MNRRGGRAASAEAREVDRAARRRGVGGTPRSRTDRPPRGRTCQRSACPATDPKIGWRAELTTYYHGVEGVAEILDDCTIRLSEFNYDGSGLDVRIYAGKDGDYAGGFALSDDLLRADGYVDETLTVVLPGGTSMSEVDGISVWCVEVGVDFGSGTFAPP